MEIQILDKTFIPFISEEEIQTALKNIAKKIREDIGEDLPVFLGILNGSFMALSDLMKYYSDPCEVSFVKMSSYQGISTTHNVKPLLGLDIDLTNRTVIVVEDIVDTGNTIEEILKLLRQYQVRETKIVTLFLKPEVYNKTIKLDYVGIEIPNAFIVGYGLDYNKQGRNLRQVYQIKQN